MKLLICGMLALFIATHVYQPVVAQTACQFVVTIDQAPLYNAPLPHISQQIGVLPEQAIYSVVQFMPLYIDSLVLVVLEDDTEGWVLQRQGETTGDCDKTPIEEPVITEYSTVCTFTTALFEPMTVPAETPTTYPVTGFEDQRYLLWMGHARSAWASQANGTLGGACAAAPTATTRENARLWTTPDVTTGHRVASLAVNTPVSILAGPVEGLIQFNSPVTGMWYRVSDVSGRIGWVWSERLNFGETKAGDGD